MPLTLAVPLARRTIIPVSLLRPRRPPLLPPARGLLRLPLFPVPRRDVIVAHGHAQHGARHELGPHGDPRSLVPATDVPAGRLEEPVLPAIDEQVGVDRRRVLDGRHGRDDDQGRGKGQRDPDPDLHLGRNGLPKAEDQGERQRSTSKRADHAHDISSLSHSRSTTSGDTRRNAMEQRHCGWSGGRRTVVPGKFASMGTSSPSNRRHSGSVRSSSVAIQYLTMRSGSMNPLATDSCHVASCPALTASSVSVRAITVALYRSSCAARLPTIRSTCAAGRSSSSNSARYRSTAVTWRGSRPM